MRFLAQLVRDGKAKVGDVIVAEYQSAGRGRLDRSFEAAQEHRTRTYRNVG